MKYAPQKGNEKAVLDLNSWIRFSVYELSLGTPYYQGGLRSKGCDMDLVLKDHKQNQREICVTQNPQRSSREWECELSPDSPDFSPECPGVLSIRAISRSIRVTFAQQLLSSVTSINTPLTPSVTLSLDYFRTWPIPNPRTSSLTPSPLILERFLEGFKWETCKRRDLS
jgi:hypothetical protein